MPTFGVVLQHLRHRYGLLPNGGGFLRMQPVGNDTLCELRPLEALPTKRRLDDIEYYIWWEKDHGKAIIAASPCLRSIRRVIKPFTIVIGEDGMPT